MNSIRRRHSIHGTTVTAGTSWGPLPADRNESDDCDASIEFESIIAAHNNDSDSVKIQSKSEHRFSQSEKQIGMNHNHNNSFRNIGTHMISKMTSSTSKLRNIAQHVVTKSVNKVRMPSLITNNHNHNNHGYIHAAATTTMPHKLKQKYHEMMSSSGDLSLACTNHIEKSDDDVLIRMSPENAILLQKSSNHTGTTRNMTLDDSTGNNDMEDVDDMFHDAEPLLMMNRHPTGSDNFRAYVQMDCHPNIPKTGTTMLVQTTTPTPSDRIDDELFQQQQILLQEQFKSDCQSVTATIANQKNDTTIVSSSQRVSPRSLRKFRMVGILEESLEKYQPKLEPIYIRVTDLLPQSPKNSPTPFSIRMHQNYDEMNNDRSMEDGQGISPSISGARTTKLRHVRSVRGGRRPDTASSLKSSTPTTQVQLPMTSKSHHRHTRVHPKVVLDRMSFGPASKHHYRSQTQRSLLVSNYQNLLIDIDPDHGTDRHTPSSQRLESKLDTIKPANELDLPISVQRRKQAKVYGFGKEATKTIFPVSKQSKTTTPTRERTQFDFDPKDLNGLCQAIEQAKIQNGSGHTQPFGSTPTKSPTTKSYTTVLIQPMI